MITLNQNPAPFGYNFQGTEATTSKKPWKEDPIVTLTKFADHSPGDQVQKIQIYSHNKVALTFEGDKEVTIHSYDLDLPNLSVEKLIEYLSHSHIVITQFDDESYKMTTMQGLPAGAPKQAYIPYNPAAASYPQSMPYGNYSAVPLQQSATLSGDAQYSSAKSSFQSAERQLWQATTADQLEAAKQAMSNASKQECDAIDDWYAAQRAQRTAELMNASATGMGGVAAIANRVDRVLGTNITNPLITAGIIQNGVDAGVAGAGALSNLNRAFDGFNAPLNGASGGGSTGFNPQSGGPSYMQSGFSQPAQIPSTINTNVQGQGGMPSSSLNQPTTYPAQGGGNGGYYPSGVVSYSSPYLTNSGQQAYSFDNKSSSGGSFYIPGNSSAYSNDNSIGQYGMPVQGSYPSNPNSNYNYPGSNISAPSASSYANYPGRDGLAAAQNISSAPGGNYAPNTNNNSQGTGIYFSPYSDVTPAGQGNTYNNNSNSGGQSSGTGIYYSPYSDVTPAGQGNTYNNNSNSGGQSSGTGIYYSPYSDVTPAGQGNTYNNNSNSGGQSSGTGIYYSPYSDVTPTGQGKGLDNYIPYPDVFSSTGAQGGIASQLQADWQADQQQRSTQIAMQLQQEQQAAQQRKDAEEAAQRQRAEEKRRAERQQQELREQEKERQRLIEQQKIAHQQLVVKKPVAEKPQQVKPAQRKESNIKLPTIGGPLRPSMCKVGLTFCRKHSDGTIEYCVITASSLAQSMANIKYACIFDSNVVSNNILEDWYLDVKRSADELDQRHTNNYAQIRQTAKDGWDVDCFIVT